MAFWGPDPPHMGNAPRHVDRSESQELVRPDQEERLREEHADEGPWHARSAFTGIDIFHLKEEVGRAVQDHDHARCCHVSRLL